MAACKLVFVITSAGMQNDQRSDMTRQQLNYEHFINGRHVLVDKYNSLPILSTKTTTTTTLSSPVIRRDSNYVVDFSKFKYRTSVSTCVRLLRESRIRL